ncbi:S-layer homology domain-containing protein [Paenibacillus paeoniae]
MSLICGLIQPGIVIASENAGRENVFRVPSDLKGHWAEKQITDWMKRGLIQGYSDGTVRPDNLINRIEFVTLANRLFGYSGTADTAFKDVPADSWFAAQVEAAVKDGYVQGYADNTFRPDKPLLRVEAAVMLSKLVPLIVNDSTGVSHAFKDWDKVPEYGRIPLIAVLEAGYIQGYNDGTIRPSKALTRAEAVVLLDRATKQASAGESGGIVPEAKTLDTAGTYGPADGTFTVAGDLIINAPGTTLRNVMVKGNLIIGKSVGDGDVFLQQVTVRGTTTINGGGEHSVHIDNSQLDTVIVDRKDGVIRVSVGGTTIIRHMSVLTDARIESDTQTTGGIEGITITTSGEVILSGTFGKVEIESDVKLNVTSGTVNSIIVREGVKSSVITLNQEVNVEKMELYGSSHVKGTGKIVLALVDAKDVLFETQPDSVITKERDEPSGDPGGGGPVIPSPGGTNTKVNVRASQPTVTGFRLELSPAVPNLTAASVMVRTAAGTSIAVESVATLTDGASYRITASLLEGEIYTVTLAKTGFDFGSAVPLQVPVTPMPDINVVPTADTIDAAGFRVSLDQPVAGLSAANFSLTQSGTGNSVAIASAETTDNGASYLLSAALTEGITYVLTITKTGYSFGSPLTVYVEVTTPEIIQVTSVVSDISETSFTVTFSEPVTGLSKGNFNLTDQSNSKVGISEAITDDDGVSYSITTLLAAGKVYTFAIVKEGYSFGAAQQIVIPGESIEVIVPTVSYVTRNGFILLIDPSVADLDPLHLDLRNSNNDMVGIDMLSAVVAGREYEVWAGLDKNDTYILSLSKEGYVFAEPVSLKVEPILIHTETDWIARQELQLRFEHTVNSLSKEDITLTDPSGNDVEVEDVTLDERGRVAVLEADLSVAGIYQYRLETEDDRYAEGTIDVPSAIFVDKYTTFNGPFGGITGLTVHFAHPVRGLEASAFQLKRTDGNPALLDAVTASDDGKSYSLISSALNSGGPYVLAITADGYDFGAPARLVNATINRWGGGKITQFMAGFNPAVPDMDKENFTVKDRAGQEVAVVDVQWDSRQRIYVVGFDGKPGHSYRVSAHASGYDFGEPRTIQIYARNEIINATSSGFTLGLNPPAAINTEHGFKLIRDDGTPVSIHSVVTDDGGGSYQIAASLKPGGYQLTVDADIDVNVFSFSVPVIATLSVEAVTNKGVTAKLSNPVNGLSTDRFILVDSGTGDPVHIQSAVTTDQGGSYRLEAILSGGRYNLKLSGHLPEAGVDFVAEAAIVAGETLVSNVSNTGFDLMFENAVPGLLPANLSIRDANNNRLTGITMTTEDSGESYHVKVNLKSQQDYTLKLQMDYVIFGEAVTFHVGRFVKGSIANVELDGHMTLRFSPALPEIENYLGLSLKDLDGHVYYPNLFESTDGGASYRLYFPSRLEPGAAYTFTLSLDDFVMSPVSFVLPPSLIVMEASASGLKVKLAGPIPGLTRNHFIVRSASGENIALSSAATDDAGASYTLAGTLASGKYYTVQYKPDVSYQLNHPVSFSVMKTITATPSQVTWRGMKVQFSERVAGLKYDQIVLRSPDGSIIPNAHYEMKTTDQGLSYTFSFGFSAVPGPGYTLDLVRDDFRLAAPVTFDIPVSVQVSLEDTRPGLIMIHVTQGPPDLTEEQFTLYDSQGRKVPFTVVKAGAGLYHLSGSFNLSDTYMLETVYPGFDFGEPLKIGLELRADAYVFAAKQTGFRMALTPAIPNLAASDIIVQDNEGTRIPVQSLATADAGRIYDVMVPLAGGKTYTVTLSKDRYRFGTPATITLNTGQASISELSVKGFMLHFASPISMDSLSMVDDQGRQTKLYYASGDGGLTYHVSATLAAGVRYTLNVNKWGYDFGQPIPIYIKPVIASFEGTESGNNHAFTLRFTEPVPGMRVSDFKIRRSGNHTDIPIHQVTTTDGGYSYKIESSFWGGETYTVLPLKSGYDFGEPVKMDIPVIVNTAVIRAGGTYTDIGLSPPVPGLNAGNFKVEDSAGRLLSAVSAVTTDGGATYRLTSSFAGGQTYTVAIEKTGYDLGEKLSVFFPSEIAAVIGDVNAERLTVQFAPAVSGLSTANFTLRDASGKNITVTAIELNGGAAYTLSAALNEGESYTLALTAPGYTFGPSLTADVAVTVEQIIAEIRKTGFTVNMSKAVTGLNETSFLLKNHKGEPVALQSAISLDGGLSYQVQALLAEGQAYTLSVSRNGFDFGMSKQVVVPVQLTAVLTALTSKGFTLQLPTAVVGLTATNLSLVNQDGVEIAIGSVTTADGGLKYSAAADLTGGDSYKLAIKAQGYDFGVPLQLHVRRLSAADIRPNGFTLKLSIAIPKLSPAQVELKDEAGNTVALNPSTFFDSDANHANAGKGYTVSVPLAPGTLYTMIVNHPSYPVEGPLEVVVPLAVRSQVISADREGITLSLSSSISLQADMVQLKREDGEIVAVSEIIPGESAGTYKIAVVLAEGSTYTLQLDNKKYAFGHTLDVYVPIQVDAAIATVNENGLTISLSAPVQDLKFTLMQGGNPVTIKSVTASDNGLTYRIEAGLGYNREHTLKLDKPGHDFGADLKANHVSTPPMLLSAVTSESGAQVILTFDKSLTEVPLSSGFGVKINGKWQTGVHSALGADPTQIILTWNANGQTIDSKSAVGVAFSGINRIKARNEQFLAVFEETPVANTATATGFVMGYATTSNARYVAEVLHNQYGKSALETARLLTAGGFKTANLYSAVYYEYRVDNWSEYARLLHAMDMDALTLYDALNAVGFRYFAFMSEGVGALISAGFTAEEIGPALRKFGVGSNQLTHVFQRVGISAQDTASVLSSVYREPSEKTVEWLKAIQVSTKDIALIIQPLYKLTNEGVVEALAEGKQSAAEIVAVIKELYHADATESLYWLSQAGFTASDSGAAVKQHYSFDNATAFTKLFLDADFSAAEVYAIARGAYSQKDAATALLKAGFGPIETGAAVIASGDKPGVIISAMNHEKYDLHDIAKVVKELWGSTGTALSEVMQQFGTNGYDLVKQAMLLREVYEADIATAAGVLNEKATQSQRNGMLQYLLRGGYEPDGLALYFMNDTAQLGRRIEVFRQLKLAGLTNAQAMSALRDALIKDEMPFTMIDAVLIFNKDTMNRYEANEVLEALRIVFAQDAGVTLNATTLATAMNSVHMFDKFAIAKALQAQIGMTMEQWVELERTDAFKPVFNCPCAVSDIVRDTQYVFPGTTIEAITVAMSMSKLFTLDEIIEGTINFYPTGGVRAKGLPYLTAALKNGGYPFEQVAAVFDQKGWTDWIEAFSKHSIAASDVTAYLQSIRVDMEEVIVRLAPYPLKDRALVLRESYELDQAAAVSLLVQLTNEDKEDISQAVAWAYGGDPIPLWIQSLRAQGATAASVINTLGARYPSYWQADKVGRALMQGGFGQEEVMGALISRSSAGNLKETVRLLQQMYGQQQISISQLLDSSSSESPQAGIIFLKNAGYKLADVAGALKNHYGLSAGESAQLLLAAYPYDQKLILTGLANLYGQKLETTIAEALDKAGITTVDAAIDFLRSEGYALQDVANLAKERFGLTAGQTAALFAQKRMTSSNNALVTAVAAAYGLSVEPVIHGMLTEQGKTSYADAIVFVYQSQFMLATSIKVAKNGYGLSAGEAMQNLLASNLYRQSDIVTLIAEIYGSTQRDSIVDSLKANHLDTLGDAVLYLQKMSFGLRDIIRVGKEHYGLTAGEATTELMATGYFGQSDVEAGVASIYGQTLAQTMLDALTAMGITTFADVISELEKRQFALGDIVLAAKDYYKESPGEATYALMQSGRYKSTDIVEAVGRVYGKPITQSLEELLQQSGMTQFIDAAPLLRSMGYGLEDVIGVAKNYYGSTAAATIEALKSQQLESESIITLAVQHIYGEGGDQLSGMKAVIQALEEGGVATAAAAVPYLWNKGFTMLEIAATLKSHYSQSAAEAVQLIMASGVKDTSILLSAMNAVYGGTVDDSMMTAFKSAGLLLSAEDAARVFSAGGYRLDAIVQLLKTSYGKKSAEAKEILAGLGKYAEAAIQSTVEQVYGSVDTSSYILEEALRLYGVKTAEGAVSVLHQQGFPLKDILQYLKDHHQLSADEATTLVMPYYAALDVGWAIIAVYYSSQNIGNLIRLIPPGYVSSGTGVVGYMKGTFKATDIVLALRVLFQMDALEITNVMSGALPDEQIRAAVTEVFGTDPLFAYLKQMKDNGANAASIAAELDRRGLLETAPDTNYLVDTLLNLGFDHGSILTARYLYYNSYLQNAGSASEQAAQLVRLGANTPSAIVQYMRSRSRPHAIQVIEVVRIALPNASMADTALTMRDQGYDKAAIMGALSYWDLNGDDVAAVLKKLGLNGMEALYYLKNRSEEEQVRWLIHNGYTLMEYLKYFNFSSGRVITVLRESGYSADDLAITLSKSTTMSYYSIALSLYNGGFTEVADVAGALIAARDRPHWVLGELQEIGGWTLKDVAKGMLDSGLISLVELVQALQMANGNNLKETYLIIKEISVRERQALYDELSSVERRLLSNNEIAIMITISALRNAGIKIDQVTGQLRRTEAIMFEPAIKLMILSGFNIGDTMDSVWDVYRDIIGIMIIQKMLDKVVGNYLSEFNNYYKLGKMIATIIARANS